MLSFKQLEAQVRRRFEKENRGACHDFTHVERVMRNARVLLKTEKADREIVMYACLLHDLVREARHEEKGNHALESARMAEKILPKYVLKSKIPAVLHAIKAHSRSSGEAPRTPEARVVRDADKLDFCGVVGVMRYIAQGQELGWSLEKTVKIYVKKSSMLLVHGSPFLTKAGKRLGKKKIDETKAFVKKVLTELA